MDIECTLKMANEDFLACNVELVNKGLPLLHGEEIDGFKVIVKGRLLEEVYTIATKKYNAEIIDVNKHED